MDIYACNAKNVTKLIKNALRAGLASLVRVRGIKSQTNQGVIYGYMG